MAFQANRHVLGSRVRVSLPGNASGALVAQPGRAVVSSFPIMELMIGGCNPVHEDELLVPACQLLHLPWKEEIRCRN